jgi:hypothetical protein
MLRLLLLLLASHAVAQPCTLTSGKELSEARQKQFQEILSVSGDPAAVHFDMALGYAKLGNTQKALQELETALSETPWLDPSAEKDLAPIAGCARFKALTQKVQRKWPKVAVARQVFEVGPADLIPEGLVADSADGSLLMSSIYHRKIVRIARDGKTSDFVQEGQDGLLSVLGMKVDPSDRSIWAASERSGATALFHFDRNGRTLAKYVPKETGKHGFNDLVLTPAGDVFVTDSLDRSVYRLRHGSDSLERISLGARFYPNGIAISDDGKLIYVAHAFGIVCLDPTTHALAELRSMPGISTAEIDGMYFRKGSLIAVQNGLGANRIVLLHLAADGKSVIGGRPLEFRSSLLDLPTTGAILNDKFYYVANTQLNHEDEGKLKDPEQLQRIKIAELNLIQTTH